MNKLQVDIDQLSKLSEPVTGFEAYVYPCWEVDDELAKKDARINLYREALEKIAAYPVTRDDELGYDGCRLLAREALGIT